MRNHWISPCLGDRVADFDNARTISRTVCLVTRPRIPAFVGGCILPPLVQANTGFSLCTGIISYEQQMDWYDGASGEVASPPGLDSATSEKAWFPSAKKAVQQKCLGRSRRGPLHRRASSREVRRLSPIYFADAPADPAFGAGFHVCH